MKEENIANLLKKFKDNHISLDEALKKLKSLPFENLGFAKVDHHRSLRTGFPEVVFCQGKTTEQVLSIYDSLQKKNSSILLTRAEPELFEMLHKKDSRTSYNKAARTIVMEESSAEKKGCVLVITAGTADIPVAEEAAVTASVSGSHVETLYDVGVAGMHRLLDSVGQMQAAKSIVVVAGMEGALPAVVGGLVACPVIAVPTSVGYGAHLGGIAPLLTMLNSCAPNVTVVNIDNGFGGGFVASIINRGQS